MATIKAWQDEPTVRNWIKTSKDPNFALGGSLDRPELQFMLDNIMGRTTSNNPTVQNQWNDWKNKYLNYDITTPDPVTPTVTTPLVAQPTTAYTPIIPDSLSVNSILDTLSKPTSDIVSELLMAQSPIISKTIMSNVGPQQAEAQSGFMRRGMTGSSTELGTIFKDIPEQANASIADALAKIVAEAYPVALQEKQLNTGTAISLRKAITDEQYNSMSLDQKAALANQDAQLKMTLQQIEQSYDRDKTAATFEFTAAQNEANRAIARQSLARIESAYSQQRQDAFFKSLSTLFGAGVGGYIGKSTGTGGFKGAETGAGIGSMLSGLFGM